MLHYVVFDIVELLPLAMHNDLGCVGHFVLSKCTHHKSLVILNIVMFMVRLIQNLVCKEQGN